MGQQRAPINSRKGFAARDLDEGRRQIRQTHEIVDNTSGRRARHTRRQRYVGAAVIQRRLPRRNTWHSVIAAQQDQRGPHLSPRLEFLDKHAEISVQRLHLAQVVGHIFTNQGNIRQITGQATLQRRRVDSPQRRT